MRQFVFLSTLIFSSAIGIHEASAHIDVDFPTMRDGNQKRGPCEEVPFGEQQLTVARPGSEMTIRITETVAHPGHLRVMFDADSTDGDDFPDPATCDDFRAVNGTTVLGDNLLPAQGFTCPDAHVANERTPGGKYEITVTLPDFECESCTMQVIQVMTDEGKADANGDWDPSGGKGLYFRCVDIKLSNTDPVTVDPEAGSTPDAGPSSDAGATGNPDGGIGPGSPQPIDGGCNTGSGPSGNTLIAVMAGLFFYGFRARKIKVSPKRTSS